MAVLDASPQILDKKDIPAIGDKYFAILDQHGPPQWPSPSSSACIPSASVRFSIADHRYADDYSSPWPGTALHNA